MHERAQAVMEQWGALRHPSLQPVGRDAAPPVAGTAGGTPASWRGSHPRRAEVVYNALGKLLGPKWALF